MRFGLRSKGKTQSYRRELGGGTTQHTMSCRTTPREGTGMPPFHLVYGGEAVVPTKIEMSFMWVSTYNEDNVMKHSLELDLVEESRIKP